VTKNLDEIVFETQTTGHQYTFKRAMVFIHSCIQ